MTDYNLTEAAVRCGIDVIDASGGTGVAFRGIGPVELKGVTEPMELYLAHRGGYPR